MVAAAIRKGSASTTKGAVPTADPDTVAVAAAAAAWRAGPTADPDTATVAVHIPEALGCWACRLLEGAEERHPFL